ncbi:MAG: hypothetical protein ACLFR0_04845, partial [Alphaproteobacteria bacterium]
MLHFSLRKTVLGFSALALLGSLAACTNFPREEAAKRISAPVWMIEREVDIDGYAITVHERMHERYKPAHIYIEGDGITHSLRHNRRYQSINPTPINPVALHMAAHDLHDNVAHLARPCQYSGMTSKDRICGDELWKGERYSAKAVALMNDTINEIKARYNLTDLHLIGYNGGGAIATILAAKRDDVVSLRTVAAILDHKTFTAYHDIPPFE